VRSPGARTGLFPDRHLVACTINCTLFVLSSCLAIDLSRILISVRFCPILASQGGIPLTDLARLTDDELAADDGYYSDDNEGMTPADEGL
jgi:hypothetical protein